MGSAVNKTWEKLTVGRGKEGWKKKRSKSGPSWNGLHCRNTDGGKKTPGLAPDMYVEGATEVKKREKNRRRTRKKRGKADSTHVLIFSESEGVRERNAVGWEGGARKGQK